MSVRSKMTQWGDVSRFCIDRVADYGELFSIELAQARIRFAREVIAFVALAVAGLFTLSFFCIAIIASALGTPHFLEVVWGVAAVWFMLLIASFVFVRSHRPVHPFRLLVEELHEDLQTVKEAMK